jgi:hypothetical protein
MSNSFMIKPSNGSYADQWNLQYGKSESHFVGLAERFDSFVGESEAIEFRMMSREFRRRHPEFETIADVQKRLCRSLTAKLSDIEIDVTMQRLLNLNHVLRMLADFKATKVMPIQCYIDENRPGRYVAWDGQHTAILLYILSTMVFYENPADFDVPIVLYDVSTKAEIRENFIGLNGEDKLPLDAIDVFQQMIYGVRVDGSEKPIWLEAERKQQMLEKHKLFVTAEKFDNTKEIGAISRMQEIMQASPEVVEQFGKYWSAIRKQRAVDPKEIYMLMSWLMLAEMQSIDVDDNYIYDLADMNLGLFDANFSPTGAFWAKCETAYENWYEQQPQSAWQEPSMQKQPTHGLPFFNAQITKSLGRAVPTYRANNGFTPDEKDLW